MRVMGLGLIAASLALGSIGTASATQITGCTTYASADSNGATSFPGTLVGTVGAASGEVCQIGDLSAYNGGSGGAYVSTSANPSIYELYWGGGVLSAYEQIGNDGTGNVIGAEFDSLDSQSSTAPSATLGAVVIPFSLGPSSVYTLIANMDLAAGYYAIDTHLVTGVQDPNYQITFAVPEPASLPLLALPLLAMAFVLHRRRNA